MEETVKTGLQCGFGKREITPPLGTPIAGYYRKRFTKGVLDPLYVRAAFFQDGDKRAVILAMDLIKVISDWGDVIRNRIGEAFDLDPDAVIINACHTHTGPVVADAAATDATIDPAYATLLEEQALCAAGEAFTDLAPARLFFTETEAKGISFVRRYRMKDGSVKTNPKEQDEIVGPLGEPNDVLRLLKIQREGADDVWRVNFGTHADTVHGEYISADWPGFVCSILERSVPGVKCMFLLGPQGDVNHVNFMIPGKGLVVSEKAEQDVKETAAHARFMGRVIAGEILKVCDHAGEIENAGISFAKEEMRLPANRVTEGIEEAREITKLHLAGKAKEAGIKQKQIVEAFRKLRMFDAPPYLSFYAYALKIGGFVYVGGPGEAFTEIGRRIRAASPFPHTMVCTMTNGSSGYVPAGNAYDEGGYEAQNSNYLKGADDEYVRAAVEALKKLEK